MKQRPLYPGLAVLLPRVHRPLWPAPHTWEWKQLTHSIRWTIDVPQAMEEERQRHASTRGQHPSLLVQEALAPWLAEEV